MPLKKLNSVPDTVVEDIHILLDWEQKEKELDFRKKMSQDGVDLSSLSQDEIDDFAENDFDHLYGNIVRIRRSLNKGN